MGDTMPKQDQSGQPEVSIDAETPLPSWVGPVKAAVTIMSVLILMGLVMLVYGLATGLNKKTADKPAITFQHPGGAVLVSVSSGAEGSSLLHFRLAGGGDEIIILAPDHKTIAGRISLEEAADFGVTFR